jgi:hypothetical protein
MLQTAFAPVLGRDSEFIEDWGEMFPSVDVDVNMHQQVLVRNACHGGNSKQGGDLQSFYNEMGRFSSDLHEKKHNPSSRRIPKCGDISQSHPLSKQPSLFSVQDLNHFDWMDMDIPDAELRE